MDLTPLLRRHFVKQAARMDAWAAHGVDVQNGILRWLLRTAAATEYGRQYDFAELAKLPDEAMTREYARRVPVVEYEQMRPLCERMVQGQRNLLWPGRCTHFAQSSGTSGGKSKYVPITTVSLRRNHYAGASDAVASYLRLNPRSRLFSGKAFILGGSFANELADLPRGVRVGDLSATLIEHTPRAANLLRIPDKRTALMADWEQKLSALIAAARRANVTNLSGVPSWFLVLLRRMMAEAGVENLCEIWPNLEVFFHGGISFRPYREQYEAFTDPAKMHFLETYNASEGFFAVQTDFADPAMQLLLDRGVYYELAPLQSDGTLGDALPLFEDETGRTYALIISACNGLWRYSLGDTVRLAAPGRITIAGRTRSYINAFGEEVMEHNTEAALAAACRRTGAAVANYTAGPVYAADGRRGRHRWLIEWITPPSSIAEFAAILDTELQAVNSDYQAKRAGSLFLDPIEVITARPGLFDLYLSTHGTGKLGGQRKVPRLSPTPDLIATLRAM